MTDTFQQDATLSAPLSADYFSVFSLPRKLALDVKALERSFYRLSREVHPDRFANAPAEKQQWSLQQTSLLNDAYRTLKAPISRTEYLLRLEGVTVADEARGGSRADGKKNVPPELLAEVFELNMQLEEMRMNAKMGEDDPQLRADLEAARTAFEGQFAEIDNAMESEWLRWDATVSGEDPEAQETQKRSLDAMAALLDRRRYIANLVRDVREALAG